MTIFTLLFSFTFYFYSVNNYDYLSSQQTTFSNALQEESIAISNLVQQESTYSMSLQQANSAVNNLQQSVTNLNRAQSSANIGEFLTATPQTVTYAGTTEQMYTVNVTGYTTLYVYLSEWSTTNFGIYFSQNQGGPYFNTYCAGVTPDVCSTGNGNSIATVTAEGNYIGITGLTSSVANVTIYAVK